MYIVSYILIALAWIIVYSNISNDGSVLGVIRIIILVLGCASTALVLFLDSRERKEHSDSKKRYFTLSYYRDDHSRESEFVEDYEYFCRVHNIGDPEFFAMQCIKACMEGYDQAVRDNGRATIDDRSIKLRVTAENTRTRSASTGHYIRC